MVHVVLWNPSSYKPVQKGRANAIGKFEISGVASQSARPRKEAEVEPLLED